MKKTLTSREKWMISMAGFALLFYFLYQWIWSPFLKKMDSLESTVRKQQTLLTWIGTNTVTVRQWQFIQKQQKHYTSLESFVNEGIQQFKTERTTFTIQRAQARQIQVQIQQVPFDQFISWLEDLTQYTTIFIEQITITAQPEEGIVNVQLTLKEISPLRRMQ